MCQFFLAFPIFMSLPVYFSKTIQQIGSAGLYFMAFNNLIMSKIFMTSYLLLFVLESILQMALLIILSSLNINEFKKVMRRKLAMNVVEIKKMRTAEIKFTKVIYFFVHVGSSSWFAERHILQIDIDKCNRVFASCLCGHQLCSPDNFFDRVFSLYD